MESEADFVRANVIINNQTYLLEPVDDHNNTLFIQLSKDGSYWNVNSGGVFRKGYSNKKETVAKTEPQQPNNAISSGSSLSKDEPSGKSSIEPTGEPTVPTNKGSENTQDNKGNLQKNAEVDKQQEEKQNVKHHKAIVQNGVSPKEVAMRDAIVDIVRESRIEVGTNNEGAQRVLDWANDVRLMSFGEDYDYDKYLDGRVEPGLSDKIVHVESAKLNHGFTSFDEAREWAKKHIVRTLNNEESGGKGNVKISRTAVDKYLSESAVTKSESKDVHLAVLKKLPEVIRESIDVETHPDFQKSNDDKRTNDSAINKNVLIHRCYGAVSLDGNIYRVKITLKEYRDKNETNKAYSYEATKIELLVGTLANDNGITTDPRANNSISATNLLKDVEMSYRPGVKVLEESKKRSESIREHRVYHGSGADFDAFDHSYMGEGEGAQAYGWGTYVTEVEGIGRTYASTLGKVSAVEYVGKKMIPANVKERIERKIKEVGSLSLCKEDWMDMFDYCVELINEAKKENREPKSSHITMEKKLKELLSVTEDLKDEDFKVESNRHLYTVEIPEDNGKNYIHWESPIDEDVKNRIVSELMKVDGENVDADYFTEKLEQYEDSHNLDGEALYKMLVKYAFRTPKDVSEFLSSIGFVGISYPAEYLSGGRKDGAKNFVIFNVSDAQIVDRIRFFRTPNGEAYGFTIGGKIYIDTRIATAETPIHEYSHLWAQMLREQNPKEWANIVNLMKGTSIWNEIKGIYIELKTDDEIADEVLAHYSGKRGAEKLRAEEAKVKEGNTPLSEKIKAIGAIERVRKALYKFWKGVADTLGIHFTTAEEVADRVMYDLLSGLNPTIGTNGNPKPRFQFIGEKGATSLEAVNERFNHRLSSLIKDKQQKNRVLSLGKASQFLIKGGVEDAEIFLEFDKVIRKSKDGYKNEHPYDAEDLYDLPQALHNPIAVFKDTNDKLNDTNSRVILTEIKRDGRNFIVVVKTVQKQRKGGLQILVSEISTLFPKDERGIIYWIIKNKATNINREKALRFIEALSNHPRTTIQSEELSDATKVVKNFVNPKLSDENLSEEGEMYRIREEEPPTKTGIGYKVFVLKNSELYPPMVANPNGEATPVGVWLDADAAPIIGQTKTGRNQVKAGGKGTQGGSGELAYRPGWHLGEIPYALQFNRKDENGNKTLFPANFVWAEVEYADDVDYQEEAMSYGYSNNGKFRHSYAGLPKLPKNGSYKYRTNPNPETDPWIITGAMRVNRLLTPTEVDEIVKEAGREPQQRQEGAITDAEINQLNEQINSVERGNADNDHYAEVSNDDKAEHAQQLAERLHLDNVEIVTSDMVVGSEKRKQAKGIYSKSTGKITIIVDNNSDLADIEQTLLHEAVAHYGLRKLFGDEYNAFLDDVYRNVDTPTRAKISRLAYKNNWNLHTATEEYLASLAEDTNFETMHPTMWDKIRTIFNAMLRKVGFTRPITDNELRYQLWRSYQNLLESREGTTNYFMAETKDNHMQQRLGVGEFARTSKFDNLPTIHISDKVEYAELASVINTNGIKKPKKGVFYGVFTADNYYIYTSNGYGNFKVRYKIPIDGNEDFIKILNSNKHDTKRIIREFSEFSGMSKGDRDATNRTDNNRINAAGRHSSNSTANSMGERGASDSEGRYGHLGSRLSTGSSRETGYGEISKRAEGEETELTDIDNPYYQPDILGEELYSDAVASEKPLTEKDEDVLLRPASIMNSEPTWDVRNESFSEYARRYAEWAHDKQVYENISGATIPPFPRWNQDEVSLRDYMAAFREWRQASNIAELAQSYGEEIRAQHNRWRRFIRKRIDEFKALESFYKYFNKNHDAEINSANDAYNDEFRKLARAEHFYTQEFYNKSWSNLNFK